MSFGSLNSNDDDYANFKQRKETIMKTVEAISQKKTQDPLKQQEIMTSVAQALDEEEETYKAFRKQTILGPNGTFRNTNGLFT